MTQHPSADVHSPHTTPGATAAGASQARHAQQGQTRQATKTKRGPETNGTEHAKQAAQTTQTTQTTQATKTKRGSQTAARKHPARRNPAAARRSPSSPVPERRVRIGSPSALLAVVPVLLGFEPSDSMVVIGTEPPRAQVRLTLRYDLPSRPDAALAADVARHAVTVLAAQDIESAVAVGYGPGPLVSPVADALREHAPRAGIAVTELLRAQHQRYWSYLCTEPTCCPPEGTPFDVKDHPAAQAMAATGVQVLASRDELVATVAPADGEAGEAMRQATRKAEEHVARLIARVARSGRKASARRLIATAGLRAVAEAIGRYRTGDRVSPEMAAWLTVVLRDLRVRDDAWSRMQPEHREAHLRLWTDLTRLGRPGYVAAPASLLAFVAWQSGNGALANVALDRALADEPRYSMAQLLRQVIDSGAPPSLARLPMTPEEVAASYDDFEACEDEACEDEDEDGEDEGYREDGDRTGDDPADRVGDGDEAALGG